MNVINRLLNPRGYVFFTAKPQILILLAAALLMLGACTKGEPAAPAAAPAQSGGLFGDGGLFGEDPAANGRSIGVNTFLWRASLDTISFMPVNSADPFGGVIITDWYSPGDATNERFKLNVYILGRSLRADGVRVAVFRQIQTAPGNWQDSALSDSTATKIEDAILTRARQLRNELLRTQ